MGVWRDPPPRSRGVCWLRRSSTLARDVSAAMPDAADLAAPDEAGARAGVDRLALSASAAALKTGVPPAVTEAFVRTRLAKPHGAFYGEAGIDSVTAEMLLERALPEA